MTTPWLQMAEQLRGMFNVIPIHPHNKVPLVKGWTERTVPLEEFPRYCRISQVCGQQPDGRFIIGPEFDHDPANGIDARLSWLNFFDRVKLDSTLEKLWVTESTSGNGYHIRAAVPRPIPGTILRNDRGKKIGDLRSTGGHLILQEEAKWISGTPWSMQTLTEEEFADLLQALNYREPVQVRTKSAIDWRQVGEWERRLSEITRDGLPHLFHPVTTGARILRGLAPARDTSDARYRVIQDLVLHGYTDEQIAAIALNLCDFGASTRKGRAWLEDDVQRILAKVRAKHPKIAPTPVVAEQPALLDAPCGKPTARRLLEFLHFVRSRATGDRVMLSQDEIAAAFGKSVRTIRRWEADLEAAGELQRVTSPDRKYSYLALRGADKTPPHISNNAIEGSSNTTATARGGDLSAPQTPRRPLYHVIEEAVDLAPPRQSPKRDRVILGVVRASVPDADPDAVHDLARHITLERRQLREDERLQAKLRTFTDRTLTTKEKAYAAKAQAAHKAGNPGLAWIWGRQAWFVGEEWKRRQPLRRLIREGPVLE